MCCLICPTSSEPGPVSGKHSKVRPVCVRILCLLALLFMACSRQAGAQSAPALDLLVLGSGGPGATGRASSSYLVLIDGSARILVDAGPGSFARLGEAGVPMTNVDLVLLTHLHIDHAGELPGLFKARALSSSVPIVFNIWGPEGSSPDSQGAYFPSTKRFLQLLFGPKGAFAYLSDFSAPMVIHAHDVSAHPGANARPHVLFKEGALAIRAIAGHHGDAPAVIYRVDYAGKSITFSGDIDSFGLEDLGTAAQGSDLLVFNSVVLDPPGSPAILYTLHTPPHAIGLLAKQAGVRAVLLSHLSPATDEMQSAVLQSIRQNYAGPVSVARDGLRIQP
jgi:ribonuclease BN (tRNA processing enzyme)